VVVGDAFSGLTVPWQLTTVQWLEEVRRVLKPNGFYAMNIVDHYPLSLLRAEIATMRTVFSHVRLITKQGKNDLPAGGNTVLLASDVPLPISEGIAYGERAVIKLEADPDLLTDNYAPVDQLQTR
jgi:spermidine synthase